jgi:hypothetical protein
MGSSRAKVPYFVLLICIVLYNIHFGFCLAVGFALIVLICYRAFHLYYDIIAAAAVSKLFHMSFQLIFSFNIKYINLILNILALCESLNK